METNYKTQSIKAKKVILLIFSILTVSSFFITIFGSNILYALFLFSFATGYVGGDLLVEITSNDE